MKFYSSKYKQLDLELFRSSLAGLDKSNRWVLLGDLLPWSSIEKEYNSRLQNEKKGAGNKPARLVIGAMIIKHKMKLSDEETVEIIRENPYMQYFCGMKEFSDKPIFDPSLFVTIRKRMSEEELNAMTLQLMEEQRRKAEGRGKNDDDVDSHPVADDGPKEFTDSKGRLHKGVLKIDATCAEAEVRHPVDVDLLHDGCRKVHEYISLICKEFCLAKPRTCYRDARKSYLMLIKTSKKSGPMVWETIGKLLAYLKRDIRQLVTILGKDNARYELLTTTQKRILSAILAMWRQQEYMYKNKVHQCADRIISVFQPHVRPIVRGKARKKTEFGAKIGASNVDGYTFVDRHSWDAYNECNDMTLQIKLFKERFGCLPATILQDKIYMNKENRKMLADLEIRTYCKPLGRPPKETPPQEKLARMAKAVGERNEIECSFGTAKRIYRADNIRAKLPDTARCWTGMCYFVKNVMKFLRELCHALTEIWQFLQDFHMILYSVPTKRGLVGYPQSVDKY